MKKTLLILLIVWIYGCNSNSTNPETAQINFETNSTNSKPINDFELKLVKNKESNTPIKVGLDNLELEDEPIVNIRSIQSYEWLHHKIDFTNEAKEKIKLNEPLFGRYFVVCVYGQKIYWGLFTDYASSASCHNPVIIVLSRGSRRDSFSINSLVIDRSYPFGIGNPDDKDLRNDERIYIVFLKNGKLK